MGAFSEKKKKQAALINLASEKMDRYARRKSKAVNHYMGSSKSSGKLILIGVGAVLLFIILFALHSHKAGNFYSLPSKIKQHHQTIMIPDKEQELRKDIQKKIQEKLEEASVDSTMLQ